MSIANSMWCAGFLGFGRVRITIGLPVVISPYIPAAEMPIPCCPRLIFSRWNFDPYSNFPKMFSI